LATGIAASGIGAYNATQNNKPAISASNVNQKGYPTQYGFQLSGNSVEDLYKKIQTSFGLKLSDNYDNQQAQQNSIQNQSDGYEFDATDNQSGTWKIYQKFGNNPGEGTFFAKFVK